MPDLGYLLDEKEGENKVMKKKHLLGVILFFCVVLATIIFALDRMDVISEGGYNEIREAAPTLEDVYLYEFEVKGAMHK